VRLDRLHAHDELVGDLLVRGGRRELVLALERAAEREQHAALRGRQAHLAGLGGVLGNRRRDLPQRRAEHDPGVAEAELVAVGQALPVAEAGAVHEGAVPGEAVVAQRPVAAAEALELSVRAGHLVVPRELELAAGRTAHGEALAPLRQRHDPLASLAVAEQEVGIAAPVRRDPLLQLDGGGALGVDGRQRHSRYRFFRGSNESASAIEVEFVWPAAVAPSSA
jgi:hypothetical protein